ncbi:MAG: DNA-binding response regulator [Acidobacteria bacterium]|nr:MAG: DNA-binding response regulator [Acidobacteriota bacterium]
MLMPEQKSSLTQRECEVLALLAKGKRNSEIAETLGITENTVETHLKNIFRKVGTSNRVQAATYYNHTAKTDPEN